MRGELGQEDSGVETWRRPSQKLSQTGELMIVKRLSFHDNGQFEVKRVPYGVSKLCP